MTRLKIGKLLEKAKLLNNQVILVGDTKQLSAAEAGALFKLLLEAGLSTAIIDQNLRQRSLILKQVVDKIAQSNLDSNSINTACQKLNEPGKIKQIVSDEARIEAIAADYRSRPLEVRHQTLIVAGTNADKQAIVCLLFE
ncbi:AAA family ATPase [Pleurocapsa sp. FMAR1]|uniref:AAA family ATPase n=1 Tax=Pleurocapsa sp. FMAR1 TaxID=3040204 RepID=UPI0029C87277|nr:AAA family ATPase [Pleurocapsa sp. FMAR1]